MPYLIPESIPETSIAERELFALLRRHLPNDAYVWHASALELAEDEIIPFLLMNEDAGIAALFPLDVGVNRANVAVEISAQQTRHNGFKTMLEGSESPALMDAQGRLKPALHHVCLMLKLTGRQITATGLRDVADGVVLLGADEVSAMLRILTAVTTQAQRITPASFDAVRACISPSLEIPFASKRQNPSNMTPEDAGWQPVLLSVDQEMAVKSFADIPDAQQSVVRDLDVRMIRGVAGSGKSLVLLHRAQHLAQHNPDWKILVLTYNRALADFLNARHREMKSPAGNITIQNFHSWCRGELYKRSLWLDPMSGGSPRGLLKNVMRKQVPSTLVDNDPAYLLEEFDWLREMDIRTLETYLDIERRGRVMRFDANKRRQVWGLYEQYLARMRQDKTPDWTQLISNTLLEIENGRIPNAQYHAILIDEAQDFPALWFKIIQTQLRPATNSLFMVADVAQKIYRRPVSWRTLGIDVNSRRVRMLKKSYRNTYQILKAANDVVADSSVANDLKGEGEEIIAPEMDTLTMRNGAMPILWRVKDQHVQTQVIVDEIKRLHSAGYAWGDIAIFTRQNISPNDNLLLQTLQRAGIPPQIARGKDMNMASDEVKLVTLYASKGLEFSVVFIADVDQVQPRGGLDAEELEKQIAAERRLLYVGMTRARERLYLLHSIPLPEWLNNSLVSVQHVSGK